MKLEPPKFLGEQQVLIFIFLLLIFFIEAVMCCTKYLKNKNISFHRARDRNPDLTSGLQFSNTATILVPFLCIVGGRQTEVASA